LRKLRTFETVEDSIGGVRTTSGVQPTAFRISSSVLPWRPMTIPGFSASMSTSPVSESKSMDWTPASSGIVSRISDIAFSWGSARPGSGGR